jgi:hypothetical protein
MRKEKLYPQIQGVTDLTPLTGISPPEIQEEASQNDEVGS